MDQDGCDRCGSARPADAAARLGWSHHVEAGRAGWTCPACTREHCRSIEARLDERWW